MDRRETGPLIGHVYDLTFPRARSEIGTVRVKVLAGEDPSPSTPCGAETVRILVMSGQIPKSNPDRMVGPGEITTMPVFIPKWTLVAGKES